MRQRDVLEGVAVFVAAAEAGSFSAAARQLGVSPSAVSQSVRALEERLGAPLFRRSTRSLGLTDVGRDYLVATAPALSQLRQAADDASGRSGRPAGPLRLTMPRTPFDLVVAPALASFQNQFPGVELEIAVEARLVDIVKEGFDAGLRFGNCLDRDMVAIEVAPGSDAVLVAAPKYLGGRATPNRPDDLFDHRAVMCRSQGTGVVIPWTLQSAGERMQVVPRAATIVHDLASQIDLAVRGLGIVSASHAMVARQLEAGTLTRVLPDWSSPIEALYLYFPSSRHQSAALRAFAAHLRARSATITDAQAVVRGSTRAVSAPNRAQAGVATA